MEIKFHAKMKGSISIRLPESYRGLVEGLCGTWDGDPENDLHKDGSEMDAEAYGDSWRVEDYEETWVWRRKIITYGDSIFDEAYEKS